MAVEHVKSTPITNLDAIPVSQVTTGEGGPGYLRTNGGYATVLASSSVDSTYQLVRLPSTAKVKRIVFESGAQTAGAFDLGVYYQSGAPLYTALLAAAAIDQDFFATAIDCAAAVARTDVTNESGTYTAAKREQPLWQALGLTSDPGGYFDIVATVKTTAVTTGTGVIRIDVDWVD